MEFRLFMPNGLELLDLLADLIEDPVFIFLVPTLLGPIAFLFSLYGLKEATLPETLGGRIPEVEDACFASLAANAVGSPACRVERLYLLF